MISARDNVLIRGNGERVAFTEYGDPHGEPVIFCHGWPSSRTMAELTDDAAHDLHVRVVSPDRPGIAETTRTCKSWAASSDRKSTRLNSSHSQISYAVFCLKKKKNKQENYTV